MNTPQSKLSPEQERLLLEDLLTASRLFEALRFWKSAILESEDNEELIFYSFVMETLMQRLFPGVSLAWMLEELSGAYPDLMDLKPKLLPILKGVL